MILSILRGIFILLVAVVAASYILPSQEIQHLDFYHVVLLLAITLVIAGLIIAIDVLTPKKRLSALSGAFLGLIVGLLVAFAMSKVVDLVGLYTAPQVTAQPVSSFDLTSSDPARRSQAESLNGVYQQQARVRDSYLNLLEGVKVIIGLITCYLGISLVLQTKDDFRFVIPYVEFSKQIRGTRPVLLDTSVIIDGRILDIVSTRFLTASLIVPRFVLNELQTVADSSDKLKRARGRRGLDILNKLQHDPLSGVVLEDRDAEGANVDQKLLGLAQEMQARVMTNDFNLAKVAQLRGVEVLNLNDLSTALRPVVLPGEVLRVRVMKPGEGPGQGVGYLDDGTMVVVENGRSRIGHETDITVTSTLQTSAGRMIFGRAGGNGDEAPKPAAVPAVAAATAGSAAAPPAAATEEPSIPDTPTAADTAGGSAESRSSRSHFGRNPRRHG